jgi:hypothetical protein
MTIMKMNSLFLAIFVSLLVSCVPSKKSHRSDIKDISISIEELSEIIDTLSQDYFEGRESGSEGINKAAVYIENYFKKLGIGPFFENYRDSFVVHDMYGFNVIGLIKGNDPMLKDEFIILSAHYDHIGKKFGAKEDSVYNGANDNATGVSTVLNIAKIIAENNLNKRSIIIALFSAEELGLVGSEHFANKIFDQKDQAYCAVNIDMIGSVLSNHPAKVYLSGYKKSNMAEILNNYIGTEAIVNWKNEEAYSLFMLSDNYPIYQVLKIPAHTFCTFDFKNYKHYHQLSDEIDKIDLNNTLLIANHICKAFIKLAESSEKEIKLNN